MGLEDLNASARLLEVISRHWGYDSFRPLQQEAMEAVLQRRDSVVVLPTGGGKSLCYQAPALLRDGLTVVVSPLISLMKDQVDGLIECGVAAAQLNSSMTTAEQREVEEGVRAAKYALLFVSPERLALASFRRLLSSVRVEGFAIDEAHCISHWGHDFRPEYRQLRELRELFPEASIHAYTATATERVRRDIVAQLNLREPLELVGSFDRPNLQYRVVPRQNPLQQIEDVIARHKNEAGIIYCIRRRDVDELTSTLKSRGYSVVGYHAGLTAEERRDAQEAFANERCDLVVATVAFGMGIDRSNVRFVIHYGMPKSIEHYQQESGRAGRDGLEAECILLHAPSDVSTWRRIFEMAQPVDDSGPSRQLTISLKQLEQVGEYCAARACRHRTLVEYFGQSYELERCNACDVCLGEFDEVDDALVVAQKIVSCLVRLRDPFGAAYVTSILRGENLAKIRERGHDELSTFGILSDASKHDVSDWIRQLIAQGFVHREGGMYPTLHVTPSGRELLRGNAIVHLTRARKSVATSDASWNGVDRNLFEMLRAWRKGEAERRGVAPFVIFSDASLRQLSAVRPSTTQKLREVYGVGDTKVREFGAALLEIIGDYCRETGAQQDMAAAPSAPRVIKTTGATREAAFDAFRRGESVASVAAQLERAESTIGEYLTDFIETARPRSVDAWVSSDRYEQILAVARELGTQRLKPIREVLGTHISYEEIRIVLAHQRASA